MINEERVKEQYKVALYDTTCKKSYDQVTTYYKWDFVGKEILKSFFSGTFAFIGVLALYIMYHLTSLIEDINTLDYVEKGSMLLMIYILFMVIYLALTIIIYSVRYSRGRKALRDNAEHLKKIYKMYEREEKLKA